MVTMTTYQHRPSQQGQQEQVRCVSAFTCSTTRAAPDYNTGSDYLQRDAAELKRENGTLF